MNALWVWLLAGAVLTALLGMAGDAWRRSKRRRSRTRPAWDVPSGVTAQDVADAYRWVRGEGIRHALAEIQA